MTNTFYKTYYHIIWGTKNGLGLIDAEVDLLLNNIFKDKVYELNCELIEYNSYVDHCHLLVSISPSLAVSEFVGILKGASSYALNKKFLYKGIKWQRGFGVLTIDCGRIEILKEYIRNQKKHHNEDRLNISLECWK